MILCMIYYSKYPFKYIDPRIAPVVGAEINFIQTIKYCPDGTTIGILRLKIKLFPEKKVLAGAEIAAANIVNGINVVELAGLFVLETPNPISILLIVAPNAVVIKGGTMLISVKYNEYGTGD